MNAKRDPITLPPEIDSKVIPDVRVNEKGRTVTSGVAADLRTAMKVFALMLKRRRGLFLEDAHSFGYAKPSLEEKIYWTYVYYNAGEPAGRRQLRKYEKKRKLATWIHRREFKNALVVLESWRQVSTYGLFK